MQKFAAAVLLCALAASTLPATSAQNPACTADAQSLVNDCSNLITLFSSDPTLRQQATALNGASDAQIQAAINATPNAKPSPACCADVQKTLSAGCRCDSNVVPLAQGLGLQPGQFFTIGRAGILACGLPSNTDTAPNPCAAPAGGK
ncbi:g9714 [Coccomyxa viridis]|uniref:G9714 protein n=1 Tax=Coccomyxa viridis TaxID=1274662 RepID=A0ABP1G879_9CHLO